MNTRQKGKLLENHICDQIKALGLDLHARPSDNSGATNREKADIWTSMTILGQNAGIEAKNQKTIHIPDWWKQTKKLESLGREPILVFKQFGESLEETKAVIYLDTLLRLIKSSKNAPGAENGSMVEPQQLNANLLKFKRDKALFAVKELLKELEN